MDRRSGADRRTLGDRRGTGDRRRKVRRHTPAIYRRRRVLAALLLLNAVELVGVAVVGPGFWVGVSVTGAVLVLYLGYLRNMALVEQRRRRRDARRAAWLAIRQAEVRRAHERRAASRREVQLRLAEQREAVRRAIAGLDRAAPEGPIRYGQAGGYTEREGRRGRDSRAAGF